MFDHQIPQGVRGVPHLIGSQQKQPTAEELRIHKMAQKASTLMGLTTQIFVQLVAKYEENDTLSVDQLNLLAFALASSHVDFMLQKEAELNKEIQDAAKSNQ